MAFWLVGAPILLWLLIDLGILPGVDADVQCAPVKSTPTTRSPNNRPSSGALAMPYAYRVASADDFAIAAQNAHVTTKPAYGSNQQAEALWRQPRDRAG